MNRFFIACLLAALPPLADAMPVTYDVTFTATTGPGGVGQLTWDASTLLMTGFTWDFGAGRVGGFTDSALTTDFIYNGTNYGTLGALVWENVTGEDVSPLNSFLTLFGDAFAPGTTFPAGDPPAIGFDTNGTYIVADLTTYETQSEGAITLQAKTNVPEPNSIAWLATGLTALLIRFRRALSRHSRLRRLLVREPAIV